MAGAEKQFLIALARAFGGALLFALPLLMTMEMWALGSTMHPLRLALFLGAMFPVLGGLAYYAGFEKSFGWLDFLLNACVAWAVAFVAAAIGLALLAALGPGMSSAGDRGQAGAAGGAGQHRRHAGPQPARRARGGGGGGGPARDLWRRAVPGRGRRAVHGVQHRADRGGRADRADDDRLARAWCWCWHRSR